MRKIYLVPALVGLLTSVAAGPLAAQQGVVPKQKAAPRAAAAGAAPVAAGAPVAAATEIPTAGADDKTIKAIDGFRSARFGMNEADARAAMVKDFSAKPDASFMTFEANYATPLKMAVSTQNHYEAYGRVIFRPLLMFEKPEIPAPVAAVVGKSRS